MRMRRNWSYGDSSEEVSRKVKEAKVETLNQYMGGDYWLDIVTDRRLDKIQREEAIVSAYTERVRTFFKLAYSIPVKELEASAGAPVDDTAKYHLIFGTRSFRAVQYMNDVAIKAIRPYLSQFEERFLFDMTPQRFVGTPLEEVKVAIIKALESRPMKRPEIYESIIPKYFLQYLTSEYRKMIEDLVFENSGCSLTQGLSE